MAAPHIRAPRAVLRRIRIPVPSAPSRRWASTSLAHELWATDEGINIQEVAEKKGIKLPLKRGELPAEDEAALATIRTPHNIAALHLRPLRRVAKHGIPVCDLQLRTYSYANMELFADFALRAAYYLGLPAKGPIPLPRITERWTVPRSNFIFKKSQENFERITMRRLIQIQDGHPETVRLWLGILQKYQYHGVGMKANVWEWESLNAGAERDAQVAKAKPDLDKLWKGFGARKESILGQKVLQILSKPEYGGAMEVSKQEDDKQRARMDATDEARKQEEQALEDEEFDQSFVKMYGPEAYKAARQREGYALNNLSPEEQKKEVERMNRVLSVVDTLDRQQLLELSSKWDQLVEQAEEADGYSIRDAERIMAALSMGEQSGEISELLQTSEKEVPVEKKPESARANEAEANETKPDDKA